MVCQSVLDFFDFVLFHSWRALRSSTEKGDKGKHKHRW
jgi:hypothetical protein